MVRLTWESQCLMYSSYTSYGTPSKLFVGASIVIIVTRELSHPLPKYKRWRLVGAVHSSEQSMHCPDRATGAARTLNGTVRRQIRMTGVSKYILRDDFEPFSSVAWAYLMTSTEWFDMEFLQKP